MYFLPSPLQRVDDRLSCLLLKKGGMLSSEITHSTSLASLILDRIF